MKFKYILLSVLIIQNLLLWSQQETDSTKITDTFWKNVHFGGGLQLGISNTFTTIGISPSGIYEFSDKISAGFGLSYLYSKNKYTNTQYHVFGTSALAIYNPIREIQLSTELEELNINSNKSDSYWIPAWYMGLAYSIGKHSAIGIRYDVLFDDKKSIYVSPFTPFVRIYF